VNVVQLVLGFAFAMVAAVVSALMTVKFALRRFYSEKWWEKKLVAYTAVIEAIHYIEDSYAQLALADFQKAELSAEQRVELSDKRLVGLKELKKMIALGEFVLPNEVVREMRILSEEVSRSIDSERFDPAVRFKSRSDSFFHLNGIRGAAEACAIRITSRGRMDLGIKDGWYYRVLRRPILDRVLPPPVHEG
jgi:hypothetical protein